jgi:hypothetical protein
MSYYFAFVIAAFIGFFSMTLGHPCFGLFMVGAAYGGMLHKWLEDA